MHAPKNLEVRSIEEDLKPTKNAGCANLQHHERQPHKARLVPLHPSDQIESKNENQPASRSKPRPQTQQQIRYGQTAKLINEALRIIARSRTMSFRIGAADVKEELKQWAAKHGIEYDTDMIANALDVADEQLKKRTAG